jgi:hypothetical protein
LVFSVVGVLANNNGGAESKEKNGYLGRYDNITLTTKKSLIFEAPKHQRYVSLLLRPPSVVGEDANNGKKNKRGETPG